MDVYTSPSLYEDINSLSERIRLLNDFLVCHPKKFDSEIECLLVAELDVMQAYKEILLARFKLMHKKEVK